MAKGHVEGLNGLLGAGVLQLGERLCIEYVRASLRVLRRADAIERAEPVRDAHTRADERDHRNGN